MADIFISYAREDRSRIEPLAKSLEDLGWSVFWDRTIPAGKTWRQVIGDALKNARSVIVAWSKDSIESDWVQEEADRGRRRNILIPIFIDNVDPPLGFGAIQAADLTNWQPKQPSPEFEKLIADISDILGPSPKHLIGAEQLEAAGDQKRGERIEYEPKPVPAPKRSTSKSVVLIVLAVVITAGITWIVSQFFLTVNIYFPSTKSKTTAPNKQSEVSLPKNLTNSIGMEFVLIPAGSFTMGSSTGSGHEKPPHDVKIPQSFYIQTTEVSQGQWKKVMDYNPSRFKECGDDRPIEQVSWKEAKQFIEKLNQLEKTKVYRLPSEAEWEYACRAGTTTEYYFGDDTSRLSEYAWYIENSNYTTHPLSTKNPNSWMLKDILGNVWEWVEDDYHVSYNQAPDDGRAWVDVNRASDRVIRGGSWGSEAGVCRSAARGHAKSDDGNSKTGLRLARSVDLGS